MTDDLRSSQPNQSSPQEPEVRKSWWRRHPILLSCSIVGMLLAVVIGAVCWYATTPEFEGIVRNRLVSTLEQATGGRVELGAFRWRPSHLELEADNLTIHGLEAANEVPYAHIDRLFVRAKIVSFFVPKIGLSYLGGEHPVFHLIVYPDGTTNQPRPKSSTQHGSVSDTLFDLAVDRTEITYGLLLLNQQAVPFDLAANDLGVTVTYDTARDHYLADVHAADITAQRGKRPAVHSQLAFQADLARNSTVLSQFKLQTGESSKESSVLEASGSLTDYANPKVEFFAKGKIDVREVEALTAVPGLERGIADLQIQGKGNPSSFTIDGQSKVTGAAYRTPDVRVAGVDASANLHITQDDLTLTAMKVRLANGGSFDGELHLVNWLTPTSETTTVATAPAAAASKIEKLPTPAVAAAKGSVSKGSIKGQIRGITLRSALEIVAPKAFDDLGFSTIAMGTTTVDWTGNADDLTVAAKLSLSAGDARDGVPVNGAVDATYYNRRGAVEIRHLAAQTPGSNIQASGSLGVYPLSRPSSIQADLTTTNLGEFDKTLTALGLSTTGSGGRKTGAQAIPVQLHGAAEFRGTVTGSLRKPDVKGHLTATNFDTVFDTSQFEAASSAIALPVSTAPGQVHAIAAPGTSTASQTPSGSAPQPVPATGTTNLHWDSLDAQAEYTMEMISVQQATLLRGKTAIHASGQLTFGRHNTVNDQSAINATVGLQNASLTDLLAIAGSNAPVTGTLNLQVHASGVLGNLNGGGHLAVEGGEVYGQTYRSLSSDLKFAGRELDATNLKFLLDGGQITGDSGYNFHDETIHFQAKGSGFDLAHLQQLQSGKLQLAGELDFQASGSGPLQMPAVQTTVHVTKLVVNNEYRGTLDATGKLDHHTVVYEAKADIDRAHFELSGQTTLTGDYPTQARLAGSQVHVERFLRMYNVRDVSSDSILDMQVTVNGPARRPKLMEGSLDISKFNVSVGGVVLRSDGEVTAKLQNGVLHLDPLKVTGDDTNLQARGSVAIFEAARTLELHANGSVNLRLAQSFDPDITSSGHVDFTVDALGTVQNPNLAGQVKFTNVAMSLGDLPNGLSQMNGTLVFDQDRLTVQQLSAVTGGGKLQLGGFITYQQGLYGDLTATGKDIRIRYPQGVSSMADAKLRLQGTESSLLLSGSVLVTRFAISPNLDLASLKSTASAAGPLPDPNAPSNHVRLDVHITSAPELNFQNSFAKLAGDIDLRVRGTVANPALLGHISVLDGSANFAGTTYQLQRGEIYFTNPIHIDPVIDLDATARVEDYDIDVGLHGNLSNLNLTYRSEPPLPEADVFALLALGRTQEEQQIYTQEQQQAGVNSNADALLGGALNATLSNRVQKLFGVGSVKIDPTFVGNLGNSTARITLEEKIGKNATLTYATNVNSTAQQLIAGQLYITPTVSIVAQRDESGVFSLVLKIHQRKR